ncbi:MAG: hypothetical protein LAO04_09395 [Acidobacteriia bacterium]|nr:hypothetical protein [Terriglobia bacterium]
MACSGQIYGLSGRVVRADEWHENKILSKHLLRIVPPDGSERVAPGYIQMALGHPMFGRPLVVRWAFGTEGPESDPNGLGDFPAARLAPDIEGEIADQVERANALRR